MSDGELQEGSVWEAENFIRSKLNNIIVFVDCTIYKARLRIKYIQILIQ